MENSSNTEYSDHHWLIEDVDPGDHWIAQYGDEADPISFKFDA